MFGTQPQQKLPLHPRQQPHHQEQQPQRTDDGLPQGECRFITTDGQRERCSCVSFCLNPSIPGACGCGHQAWHHLREPSGSSVSLDSHIAVVDELKRVRELNRKLQDDLLREKRERERTIHSVVQANIIKLGHLKYYCDDKLEQLRRNVEDRLEDRVEQIEDKAVGAFAATEELGSKYSELEEIVMRLVEDIDLGRRPSRSLTPLLEGAQSPIHSPIPPPIPERTVPELPIRTSPTQLASWDVKIVLVPSRDAECAFQVDTVAFRRCQTRGFLQDIHLKDKSSQTFTFAVESSFTAILRRRLWMPLQCLDSQKLSLQPLDATYLKPSSWDFALLEAQCLAHNKGYGGDVIFIALKDESLSWEDIRNLPTTFGSDETCWDHDDELDSKDSMDYTTEPTRRPADTDSTYGDYNSPPPYSYSTSNREYPETPRQGPVNAQSPLHVLADASASAQPSHMSPYSAPSIRSTHSAPSISERSIASSIGSIDSTLALSDYTGESELHRDKRHKRVIPPPLPGLPNHFPTLGTSPPHHQQHQPTTQVVQQGRVKRKITTNSKYREPMDWRPSEISFKNLLHKRPSTSSGPPSAGSLQATATTTSVQQHPSSP
jgi:hypothetical protein